MNYTSVTDVRKIRLWDHVNDTPDVFCLFSFHIDTECFSKPRMSSYIHKGNQIGILILEHWERLTIGTYGKSCVNHLNFSLSTCFAVLENNL